jgi:hypothetical protein
MHARAARRYLILLLDLETQNLQTFALIRAADGRRAMRRGLPTLVRNGLSGAEEGVAPTGALGGASLVVVSLRVFDADRREEGAIPPEAATWICFHLANPSETALAIHDGRGRRVRDLGSGPRAKGDHAEVWDGRDDAGRSVAPGVYELRFDVDACRLRRRLLVNPPEV